MATSADHDMMAGAEAGAVAGAGAGHGPEENGEVVEKPSMEYIYLTDNKLKYINNKYEKVNAKMYDYKCDVKLTVGQSNFKGHKKVLSDASDYFAAMFTHAMKEKDETVIELKDISPAGFGAMLDYFYHGHVTVEHKIISDILEAARFFHVDWILEICCDYMIRHSSLLDYQLTMHLADTYSLGDLRWDIFKFFGTNLPTLVDREGFFRDLSEEFLLQYLMEYVYVEVSEYFLLQVIVNWVKFDEESRKEHMLPLLRQLRFPTMDLEELEELPREVLEIKEIRDEVEEAKCYCLNITGQCLKTGDKYLGRGSRPSVVLTSFNDNDGEGSNVVAYKDINNEEANLFIEQLGTSGLSCDYSSMNQCSLGNFLFAAGGYNEEFTSSGCVFKYDPRFREWTEVATMSFPRASFSMCSSPSKVYVVGGVMHTVGDLDGGEKILNSVEAYNPEDNSWKTLANLKHGVFDLASAYANGKLYITGGISDNPQLPLPLKTTACLADGATEWTALPDMLTSRQGHSMTHYKGKLYVLGGYTSKPGTPGFSDCTSNEVFDLETQQWTAIASTPENFGHIFRHVGQAENRIYFLNHREEDDVNLSHFDMDKETFDDGIGVGPGLHKVSVLNVAYPETG